MATVSQRLQEGFVRTLVIVASALLVQPAPALADEVDWQEPNGRYSVRFDLDFWVREEKPSSAENVLELRAVDNGDPDRFHRCVVRQTPFNLVADPDQEKLNTYVEVTYTRERALDFFRDASIGAVSQGAVNGIRVADTVLTAHTAGPDFRLHYRIFLLDEGGGQGSYHEIRCDSLMPFSPEDVAASDAFLASLQFHDWEANP